MSFTANTPPRVISYAHNKSPASVIVREHAVLVKYFYLSVILPRE